MSSVCCCVVVSSQCANGVRNENGALCCFQLLVRGLVRSVGIVVTSWYIDLWLLIMRRCNELVSQNWCSEVWRVVGNDSRYSILSPYVIYLPLHNRCCCLCRSPLGRRVCRCCRCLLTERFPSQHVVVS